MEMMKMMGNYRYDSVQSLNQTSVNVNCIDGKIPEKVREVSKLFLWGKGGGEVLMI